LVCADCPYTQCVGVYCAKAIEAFNAVQDAFPNLKGVKETNKPRHNEPAGHGVNSVSSASGPKSSVEER
jgi:hypothetical protein